VDFVPAMQRRRLSRLSKISLRTLHECLEQLADRDAVDTGFIRTVFASPHGEIHRTVDLLKELAAGEPLSPMGFSLSVHNTAAGIYSIVSGNQAASVSVAAGCDTLEQAVVEAVSQSAYHRQVIALVFADEPLPALYHTEFAVPFPFGLALCVRHNPAGAWQLQAKDSDSANGVLPDVNLSGDRYIKDIRGMEPLALLTEKSSFIYTRGERHHWCWKRG
jgi:hypothetical protein